MNKKNLSVLKYLFLNLLIISVLFQNFFINKKVKADTLSISVSVYICGNNLIEGEEFCDDGEYNGQYAFSIGERKCNSNCSGWAPYCGDGIKQTEYGEECDDGNNNSGDGCNSVCELETPPPPPTTTFRGGGGGGSIAYVPPETKVIFIGKAYPKSTVTLLKDAQIVASTIADEGAQFKITLTKLPAGNYIFSLYSEDEHGNRSSLLTFPLSITANVTTEVNNIFIAPTIDVDKLEVKKGDNITIFGKSVPNSEITILIHSDEEFYTKAKSDKNGAYLYKFDTTPLEYGEHYTKAKASLEEEISSFSKTVSFKVSDVNIFKTKETKMLKGDLNNDKKVNLIDFSIMAYWYKRRNPPSHVDLNNDGKVDIKDFSILAYYWSG